MIMSREDAKVFSGFGKAYWHDQDDSRKSLAETISAVSLMKLNSEESVEKASRALLERAKRNHIPLNSGFYRLAAEERLALVALHIGRWSYQRIGRILNRTNEEVQELVWTARVKRIPGELYPCGPSSISSQCPEYNSRRPWSQKFLDEEIGSAGDRFFLKNHLLECVSCSQYLARSREAYFKVDSEITKLVDSTELADFIEKTANLGVKGSRFRSDWTLKDSLISFMRYRDIQWILSIAAGLFVYGLLQAYF